MEDILKNIKTLLFSYTTVMLVIIFAVLQSDQEKYDRALSSIDHLERFSTSLEPSFIKNIIVKYKGEKTKVSKKLFFTKVREVIEFEYFNYEVDYEKTDKNLFGKRPEGFAFSRSEVFQWPGEFTKLNALNYFFLALEVPDGIKSYSTFHNAVLTDKTVMTLTPDFNAFRIEAYKIKETKPNSIEVVNKQVIEKFKIWDDIFREDLVDQFNTYRNCQLLPFVTEINNKYSFTCTIRGINFDGENYTGARVIVGAKTDIININKIILMDSVNLLDDKRLPFESAYPELAELSSAYPELNYEDTRAILKAEKSRIPNTLNLFGAQINITLLVQFVFTGLIIFMLYLCLHLREANRLVAMQDAISLPPWVGIYKGKENLFIPAAQFFLLPLVLAVIIQVKDFRNQDSFLFWLAFLILLISALCAYLSLLKLRKKLFALL